MEEDATKKMDDFIRLVELHRWEDGATLARQERALVLEIVTIAGFSPKEVAWGLLSAPYEGDDGAPSRSTYAVNNWCGYKVVGQDGKGDLAATQWLEELISYISRRSDEDDDADDLLMKGVEDRIAQGQRLSSRFANLRREGSAPNADKLSV